MSTYSAKLPNWGLVAMLAMVVVCLNSLGANADDTKTPATLGFLTTSRLSDAFAKLGGLKSFFGRGALTNLLPVYCGAGRTLEPATSSL